MLKDLLRRYGSGSLVLTALAAIVIGCGGGGGGGGSNGGSAGSIAGGATNGTSAGGDPVGGNLPANRIFYAENVGDGSTFNINYIREDGTGVTTYLTGLSNGDGTTPAAPPASPDPSAPNKVVFALQPVGETKFGIYRNTTVSVTGAEVLVAPTYEEVVSVQVARDGSLVAFVAATTSGGDLGLFTVSGVAAVPPAPANPVTRIDDAFYASLSSSGDRVVYNKFPSGENDVEVYVRRFAEATSVRLTTNTVDDEDPQFSKDGAKVVFSQKDANQHFRLATVLLSDGTATVFDPVPTANQRGPSFKGDDSEISFVVVNAPNDADNGLYTVDVATGLVITHVLTSQQMKPASYWTTINGRSGAIPYGFSLPRRGR